MSFIEPCPSNRPSPAGDEIGGGWQPQVVASPCYDATSLRARLQTAWEQASFTFAKVSSGILRRALWFPAVAIVFVMAPGTGLGHPFPSEELGRFSQLYIYRDKVRVTYTLSLTKLLAIEEVAAMNADGDGRVTPAERARHFGELQKTILGGLTLEVDGEPTPLAIAGQVEERPPRYRVMRFEGKFPPATTGTHKIYFRDDNYPGVIGPVEITAYAGGEVDLGDFKNVDFSKRYKELIKNPYDVQAFLDAMQMRELEVFFRPLGSAAGTVGTAETKQETSPPAARAPGATHKRDATLTRPWKKAAEKMESVAGRMFTGGAPGLKFTILAFAAFFFFGAVHALTPGHGKAVVAAYLIGSRGKARDAVVLGLIVSLTHTASVLLLAVIVKLMKDVFLPERAGPFIAAASGLVILGMGVWLFARRAAAWRGRPHEGGHDHSHEHQPAPVTLGGLVSLGVAGGMVPCPEAFAVLLAAINWQRLLLGGALILAFSAGLALVLTAVGLLMVAGRMKLDERIRESRLVTVYLPLGSAAAIIVLGAVLTVMPLLGAGIVVVNI